MSSQDTLQPPPTSWAWALAQRALGLLACLVLSPVFGLLYVLVKGTSPGPFLFKQMRRGLHGKPFTIYKVRTMTVGSEKKTALGVQQSNPSITRVGRIFRDLKLDELPQLWNLACGEMEIVGPRPIPMALEDKLREHIHAFHQRCAVKPGLSNVSQVSCADNLLGDKLIQDWAKRFEGELHYVRNKSFAYDVIVILMTAGLIVRRMLGKLFRRKQQETAMQPGSFTATRVVSVPIANLDYDGVIGQMAHWIDEKSQRYIGVCPVHNIMEAVSQPEHRRVLENADLNTADGMPVVWAQKLLGHKDASRVYGPTLMLKTLERAEREGWRMAFYGGHPDRLKVLEQKLRAKFPELKMVYSYSPPFRPLTEEEDAAIVADLNAAQPDVVWVGLGCPKQERWMAEHAPRLRSVLVGVGAAFDFHAGAVRQAPSWVQNYGLEWAFRLAMEPRRLFVRYATTNPAYLARLTLQLLGRWIFRRNAQMVMGGPKPVLPTVPAVEPTTTDASAAADATSSSSVAAEVNDSADPAVEPVEQRELVTAADARED